MVLLELDPFLSALTKMYEQSKNSGTIWVTLKRSLMSFFDIVELVLLDPEEEIQHSTATLQRQKTRKIVDEAPIQILEPSELRCLVRATDGKQKISCFLTAKNHLRFQTSYATVLKAHMGSLKKKEKNDKKEKRSTAAQTLVS